MTETCRSTVVLGQAPDVPHTGASGPRGAECPGARVTDVKRAGAAAPHAGPWGPREPGASVRHGGSAPLMRRGGSAGTVFTALRRPTGRNAPPGPAGTWWGSGPVVCGPLAARLLAIPEDPVRATGGAEKGQWGRRPGPRHAIHVVRRAPDSPRRRDPGDQPSPALARGGGCRGTRRREGAAREPRGFSVRDRGNVRSCGCATRPEPG